MAVLAAITFICVRRKFIFRSNRMGLGGRTFEIYKYSTMEEWSRERFEKYLKEHPECAVQWREKHKLFKDPRCGRWGRFMRRFSLDELPQLVNVLKGDMAMVGPRPITAEEIHHYGCRVEKLFSVKPGITGLWQVSGRNTTTYRRRVALDIYYAKNKSLYLDLWILLLTFKAVAGGKGAF